MFYFLIRKSMKKNVFKSLMMLGLFMSIAMLGNAQNVLNKNVGVTAILANQLTVTKVTDVHFGGIFIPKSADVVATMDYLGAVTITTGTTSLFSTNLQKRGQLRVDAEQVATFTVQYPATVNIANGANMLVYTPKLYDKNGVSMPSSSSTSYTVNTQEDAGGATNNKLVNIAGTLAIATASIPGTYTGNFDVTFTWQ